MMDWSLVIASVFMMHRHCSAVDSVRTTGLGLTRAQDEWISHALVSVILNLLGMAFAPSSWDPQGNYCSSGHSWQSVDPWWIDLCVNVWEKCQFCFSRTTGTGKIKYTEFQMESLITVCMTTTEFRNENLLLSLFIIISEWRMKVWK